LRPLAAGTALALLLVAGTAAAAERPSFAVDADTVAADRRGNWAIPVTMRNPGEMGLYGDSLRVEVLDRDPGVSRAPRLHTSGFDFLLRRMGTMGAGEERRFSLVLAAPCESALIRIHAYAHTGSDGPPSAWTDSVLATPGPLSAAMPSEFLQVDGRRVELVAAPAPEGAGTVPGLLLVPSEHEHARSLLRRAAEFAARGLNVVAVSPPGYGRSDGPADLAGPATLAALSAALDRLAAMPGTAPDRLAVWGAGRGATAALLLAARRPEIERVVAQDALYDLPASRRAADPATAADMVAEAGRDSAAWRSRSPLPAAVAAPARVLILQAMEPSAPARAFAAARLAAGTPVDTVWALPGGHQLRRDANRAVIEFLGLPSHP
jgi:pimeloyl-ACP methyl ester carboxylesterase